MSVVDEQFKSRGRKWHSAYLHNCNDGGRVLAGYVLTHWYTVGCESFNEDTVLEVSRMGILYRRKFDKSLNRNEIIREAKRLSVDIECGNLDKVFEDIR